MIIRRRHTANFTTIGNALFNDDRLKADEIGIIGYLLSRPHDWEVRRPQLARRFGYGRDAIKRVVWNGMRHGWIVAQKTQLADGKFFTIYEVRDQPGPELSDDEIRRALSLGSSEASEPSAEGDDADDTPSTDPPDTGDPGTGQPGVGQPAPGNPYVAPIEGATKYGFTKDLPTKAGRVFESVRQVWPAEHILSAVTAERAFLALSDADKEACLDGIKPYLSDCATQGRKVCDLRTYIEEKRWERFKARNPATRPFAVQRATPQAYRWREYLERAERDKLWMFDKMLADRGVYTAPAEWPPPLPPKDPEPATGPPAIAISEEELRDFR